MRRSGRISPAQREAPFVQSHAVFWGTLHRARQRPEARIQRPLVAGSVAHVMPVVHFGGNEVVRTEIGAHLLRNSSGGFQRNECITH